MAFKVTLIFVLEEAKIGAEPVRKKVESRNRTARTGSGFVILMHFFFLIGYVDRLNNWWNNN